VVVEVTLPSGVAVSTSILGPNSLSDCRQEPQGGPLPSAVTTTTALKTRSVFSELTIALPMACRSAQMVEP